MKRAVKGLLTACLVVAAVIGAIGPSRRRRRADR